MGSELPAGSEQEVDAAPPTLRDAAARGRRLPLQRPLSEDAGLDSCHHCYGPGDNRKGGLRLYQLADQLIDSLIIRSIDPLTH